MLIFKLLQSTTKTLELLSIWSKHFTCNNSLFNIKNNPLRFSNNLMLQLRKLSTGNLKNLSQDLNPGNQVSEHTFPTIVLCCHLIGI